MRMEKRPSLCIQRGRLEQVYRKKNGMAGAIPFCRLTSIELEGVLHPHLDDAVSLLLGGDAEVRIIRLQRGLVEAQVEVAAVERIQRMVQPVVKVETELQILPLRDLEVLEHAHIPVEIGRSVNRRENGWAVLTGRGRNRETVPVDELMRLQSACWITSHDRVQLNIRRA